MKVNAKTGCCAAASARAVSELGDRNPSSCKSRSWRRRARCRERTRENSIQRHAQRARSDSAASKSDPRAASNHRRHPTRQRASECKSPREATAVSSARVSSKQALGARSCRARDLSERVNPAVITWTSTLATHRAVSRSGYRRHHRRKRERSSMHPSLSRHAGGKLSERASSSSWTRLDRPRERGILASELGKRVI